MTRSILVTGASKGIGAACVQRLAHDGFRVLAGVRRVEDGEALVASAGDAGARVVPVLLDVTRDDQIRDAVTRIAAAAAGAGLYALVNNAGIAVAGPLEFLPMDEFRRQLEVNVTGQLAVTQAFLPLLRQARALPASDRRAGCIIFMSSVSGRSALPFVGAYAASKFALEAAADALRVELRPFGHGVVLIEPGMIATPIWETAREVGERNLERMPPQLHRYYGRAMDALRARAARGTSSLPPERVADVVARALDARRPRTRYVIGRDAHLRIALQKLLPDHVRDRVVMAALDHRGTAPE